MLNIAIDGPSGAGKSTIAKLLAKNLNITYLDTGAMYRALGYYVNSKGINVNDKASVNNCIKGIKVDVSYSANGTQNVFVNGIDVTAFIRLHHISKLASDISKIPEVRIMLVEEQRRIANEKDVVLDGRDITSYVLPNACYKFFLTADSKVRAKRRLMELKEKGFIMTFDDVLKDIEDRDYNDSHREFAPLVQTEDSILIDTTNLTIDEVISKIMQYIQI